MQRGLELLIEDVRGTPPWTGWEMLGLASVISPGVANAGFGQPLEVFGVDENNVIVSHKRFTDGRMPPSWRPVTPVPARGRPIVLRNIAGRLELFVFDSLLQRLKHTDEMFRPGGAWAGWDTLGHGVSLPISSDPSVAMHVDGRLELVARSGSVGGTRQMANTWAHFVHSAWNDVIIRGRSSIETPPSVCGRNVSGDQIVAVAAHGGRVMVIHQIGPDGRSPWTEWEELVPVDGVTFSTSGLGGPVVVPVTGAGATLHVLAIDARGNVHETTDLLAGLRLSWSPWQPIPSASSFDFVATDCRLTTLVTDRLYVFARSQRGEALEIEFIPGLGWTAWQSLGGDITGEVAAGFHEDGRVEIVVTGGSDGQIRARRQVAPGAWL